MPAPKKIINDPAHSVEEFIQGLLWQYPNHLRKLQNHNVVLYNATTSTSSIDETKVVQLISGGGSGHEPSHAGWIGQGMLQAAVCGGIFASPSVASILAAIRAVAAQQKSSKQQQQQPQGGVLLIVKNYTGDRLNFGMAAERANQQGIHTEMVVVSDDCALPRTKGITGARGVAGTVLVHKIAGAAAAAGQSLDQVARVARLVNARMGTLGVALSSVNLPGAEQVNDRLDESTIEIGLGIHGEAGMKQSRLLAANEMAREMITTIQSHGRIENASDAAAASVDSKIVPLFQPGNEICVLINNLGGTSNFEMSILARSVLELLESAEFGAKATHVFVGTFMTSFDMHGVSLTILNLQDHPELVALLDAPTTAPAWKQCDMWRADAPRPSATEIPEVVVREHHQQQQQKLPPVSIANFSSVAKSLTIAAAQKVITEEPLLTKYDAIVGDGDCGITMKRGASQVLQSAMDGTIPMDHPVHFFAALADAVSKSMGGTSGILLELMFRKIASTLSRYDSLGVSEMCQAVQAGVDAVSLYGGAQVGTRTILDALVPAANALCDTQSLSAAAQQARQGADATASMKTASAGRSNYLSEDTLAGTPDPGAVAAAIVLESLASSS